MTDTEDDPFKNPEHLANTADAMGRACKDWQTSTARYHFACRDMIRALYQQLADPETLAAHPVVKELLAKERKRRAGELQKSCAKCGGEGWLWGHELDDYEPPHPGQADDTRYACDGQLCTAAAIIRSLE